MERGFNPNIIGFLCQWCAYAGADLAGTSRVKYPSNIKIVRLPCTGRVDPVYVLRAFLGGADGVLVAGCHPGDCHYKRGNYLMSQRYMVLQRILDILGLGGRLKLEWVSASEGGKFAEVVKGFVEELKSLGPNPIRELGK